MQQRKAFHIATRNINKNQLILFGIIAVGSVLRFYNYFNLPYSHDELSALMRTNFTSFGELIDKGVKPDGHPAGIQVFIFYWVKLVGTTEWLVKLPFLLASIASIYFAYKVGSKLRNETVGLIMASFFATSQYVIIHGTSIRPYGSGIFCILLFLNALLNIKKNPEINNWKNWTLFIIAGSCASYNHHFSALATGIIAISGLLAIPKSGRIKYFIASLLIVIIYIPHLKITLLQLSYGGIGGIDGWLGKPESSFLFDYIYYIFHYSPIYLFLVIVLIALGIAKNDFNYSYFKVALKALIIFIIPISIGYYYSIIINPILQFSVLIFTHFFLYIILFGHFRNLTTRWNIIIVTAIISIGSLTLIFQRKHFVLNYSSIFVRATEDLQNYRYKNSALPAIVESRMDFIDFYVQRSGNSIEFKKHSDFTNRLEFLLYLDSISTFHDSLYLADDSYLPNNVIPDIQRFYPFILNQNNYSGGSTYLFSKNFKSIDIKNGKRNVIRYSTNAIKWAEINGEKLIRNTFGYFLLDSTEEYGPCLTIPLKKIVNHPSNYVDVIVPIKPDRLKKEILIVCELQVDGVSFQWEGGASSLQGLNGICSEINTSFKLGKPKNFEKGILKIYLWNPNKVEIQFKDIIIQQRSGNPELYGLIDQIIE